MENTDAITNLLKLHNADISAVKANKALVALGLLNEKERPSSKYAGKMKKYKAAQAQRGCATGSTSKTPTVPARPRPITLSTPLPSCWC